MKEISITYSIPNGNVGLTIIPKKNKEYQNIFTFKTSITDESINESIIDREVVKIEII